MRPFLTIIAGRIVARRKAHIRVEIVFCYCRTYAEEQAHGLKSMVKGELIGRLATLMSGLKGARVNENRSNLTERTNDCNAGEIEEKR